MINNIKISNVASYCGEGVDISGLNKVNFIYGANGCGKTTISNFIKNENNKRFADCSLSWVGNRRLTTLVYNKEFREENFSNSNISGVFTLGKATKEDLAVIEKKNADKKRLHEKKDGKRETVNHQKNKIDELDKSFTEQCWSIYKKHESDLKGAMRGSISSKLIFKERVLHEYSLGNEPPLTLLDLKRKSSALFSEQPVKLLRITEVPTTQLFDSIEKDFIWKKSIVGKESVDIAGLIGELNSSDWVHQGLSYLKEDNVCPFCQKETIDQDLRSQFESYFDKSYLKDKSTVHNCLNDYTEQVRQFSGLLEGVLEREKNASKSRMDVEAFSQCLKVINSKFSHNITLMRDKSEKLSHEFELVITSQDLKALSDIVISANNEIDNHNDMIDEYQNEVLKLKKATWCFLSNELKDEINKYNKSKEGLLKGVKAIEAQVVEIDNEVRLLTQELAELSKNVTSVQPAVEEMNRTLKSYGFTGFEIVKSRELDNHYSIQRENGELVEDTLSEGEVTFITFLYFVQLAKGGVDQDSVHSERVLVVDDPISSLDSNVLYVVSTILKSIIREVKDNEASNIKQILILTHNVFFHKEASFQGGRSNGCRFTHFWILRKNKNKTSIYGYEMTNPIETSYELLWREIREWRDNSGITLQNTMRRIIENFFRILGSSVDERLINGFDSLEEQQICRSLISWINDGSHTIPDDLYIQPPGDIAEKYIDVFEKIFIHSENHGHYKMMMGEND